MNRTTRIKIRLRYISILIDGWNRCFSHGFPFRGAVTVAGVWVLATACAAGAPTSGLKPSPTHLIDRVVADVDGEVITARDLAFWVWQERLHRPDDDAPDSTLSPAVLRNLADEILMAHWAAEIVKDVNDDAINQATEQSLADFRKAAPTKSGFESWVTDSGFDMETVRRCLREREKRLWLIRNALATRQIVRPEQLEGTEQSKKEITEHPVRVRLRQILLACSPRAGDEETSRALVRALSIRRQILNGLSFSEAAQTYSDDRGTRDSGGEVGWVAVKNLNPALRGAIAGLRRGDVSEPARTNRGWHLLQVVDLETPTGIQRLKRIRTAYDKILDEQRANRSIRVAKGYTIAPPQPDQPADEETPTGGDSK